MRLRFAIFSIQEAGFNDILSAFDKPTEKALVRILSLLPN
ncbi:conserved hypothetical protein (plasmid) [Borreliella burgdorferi WI91-23]|nr:conserved hypothetical protein [Borreliella burgdorferi 72a]ACN55276.1 conserved hypothetical protein [Borreliella burgdorferi WI91-23]